MTKDKSNFYSWLRSTFHFLNGKNYRFVQIFLIFDLFLFISCKHFVDNDYPTRVIVGIKCKYEFLTLIEKAQIRIRENWCFLNETYLWDFLRLKPFLANRFVWMIVQCELGCLGWLRDCSVSFYRMAVDYSSLKNLQNAKIFRVFLNKTLKNLYFNLDI